MPNDLIVRPRSMELVKRVDTALANIRKNPKFGLGLSPETLKAPPPLPPRECTLIAKPLDDEFDLFFMCAKYDRPVGARWTGLQSGHFRYTGHTVRVTEDLFRTQYQDRPEIEIDAPPTTYVCPWCGVAGEIVLCSHCHHEVGACRTIGNFFRCRPSCKSPGGYIVTSSFKNRGYIPGL
jgi:hypothetical protein